MDTGEAVERIGQIDGCLTSFQFKYLERLHRFHVIGFHFWARVARAWPVWTITIGVSLLSYFVIAPRYEFLSGVLIGVYMTFAASILGRLRETRMLWPVADEITNWDRVEELLGPAAEKH
jgi:hypothetical protein